MSSTACPGKIGLCKRQEKFWKVEVFYAEKEDTPCLGKILLLQWNHKPTNRNPLHILSGTWKTLETWIYSLNLTGNEELTEFLQRECVCVCVHVYTYVLWKWENDLDVHV